MSLKFENKIVCRPPAPDFKSSFIRYLTEKEPESDREPDLQVEMTDGTLNLKLYGLIRPGTKNSAQAFMEALDKHPEAETINLFIDSHGGDVDEGNQILQGLQAHPGKVIVTIGNMAASMASGIAMAGDHVKMFPTSSMMIHNPSTNFSGNAKELRHIADILDARAEALRQAYVQKAKGIVDESFIRKLMDEETFLSADKCFEYGFCDEIIGVKSRSAKTETVEEAVTEIQNVKPEKSARKGWLF